MKTHFASPSTLLQRLGGYWCDEAPAMRLAVLRILVGSFAVWYLWSRFDMLLRIGRTDTALFEPVGAVFFLNAPLPPALWDGLVVATLTLGVGFILGIRFRWVGPAFALLFLFVMCYRNAWSMLYHSRNVVVLSTLVLGFVPAADALSWDAWRGHANRGLDWLSRRIRNVQADAAYGWPIRLLCVMTIILYVLPGIAKITGDLGWAWAGGEALRSQIVVDALRKDVLGSTDISPLLPVLYDHVWLFTLFGVLTLVFELGAPLFLLNKRLTTFWAANTFLMHWGIFLLMGIRFHYQITGLIFAPFFAVEKPILWVQARWRQWRKRTLWRRTLEATPFR